MYHISLVMLLCKLCLYICSPAIANALRDGQVCLHILNAYQLFVSLLELTLNCWDSFSTGTVKRVRYTKGFFPSSASAQQRQTAGSPLLRDLETAFPASFMSFPSLCPVRGRTLPDHRPPLFFQCLAMGPELWGVPSTARMLSSYLFLCFFFMTCYVFSFVPEFSQNSSLYSLGIKSGKAPTLPARPSPELKSSHWSGCWLPQE